MTESLATLPEVAGIELAIAQPIIDAFMPHFSTAMALVEKSKELNVTDPTDLDGIAAARALRLKIRAARIASDKVRADKKEVYLRIGQAIQGIHNRVKAAAEPAEERLENMEKIAERMQAERKLKLGKERYEQLKPYGIDPYLYRLDEMPEPAFQELLANTKAGHEKRIADAKAAEEAAQRAEFERLEREEEMRAENARLKREAEEKAAAAEAERKRIEEERRLEREAAEAKRKEAEEKARKEWEAQQAKLELERKARQAEREAFERAQAEERRKVEEMLAKERAAAAAAERELAEKRRQEEAKRAEEARKAEEAAKAPDREKLNAWADSLVAFDVELATIPARNVLKKANKARLDLARWVREQASSL